MNTEQLYQQRLARYVAAMRNEKPDMVPIRPFVAELTGRRSTSSPTNCAAMSG